MGLFVATAALFLAAAAPESIVARGAAVLLAGLLASVVALRLDGGRPLAVLGLPRAGAGRGLAGGVLLGIAVFLPALAVAFAAGGLRYGMAGGTWVEYLATGLWTGLVLLVAAAGEEVFFRGYPLRVLAERWGPAPALLVTSVAFAGLHGWNPHAGGLALLNIGLAGLLLGSICLVSGSLWRATGVHAGWNLATGFFADLPVSGVRLVDAPMYEVTDGGRAVVTGGAFGLEGGAAATIGLALGIVVVARTGGVRPDWLRSGLEPDREAA